MLYAIKNTIFVNAFTLERRSREIEFMEVDLGDMDINSFEDTFGWEDHLSTYSSPRNERKNGKDLWIVSDHVSWIYFPTPVDHYSEWINFCRDYYFEEGRDYFSLNVYDLDSIKKFEENCKWLKIVQRNKFFMKLEVVPRYLFQGHIMLPVNG